MVFACILKKEALIYELAVVAFADFLYVLARIYYRKFNWSLVRWYGIENPAEIKFFLFISFLPSLFASVADSIQ